MTSGFVKLVDYSLIPFCVLILGKLLGLYLTISGLGIEWGVADFVGSFFSATPLVYGRDVAAVTTYSNLVMFSLLFFITAVQTFFAISRRKIQLGLGMKEILLISSGDVWQEDKDSHTKLFVWYAYLFVALLVILVDFLAMRAAGWLLGFSLLSFILLVSALISSRFEFARNL